MKIKIAVVAILIAAVGVAGAWAYVAFQKPADSPVKTSHPRTDTSEPSVALNIPKSSLDLVDMSKVIEVSVTASDNAIITKVEYLLDEKVVARSVESPYFTTTINLASLTSGEHTLQAAALDSAGNRGKSEVFTFTIKEQEVIPADDQSQDIVKTSSARRSSNVSAKTASQSSSSNPSTGGSTAPGGGNPDPDPDPTPDPEESLRTAGGWFASLPTQMQACSNAQWNDGPSVTPAGAVVVPAGNNSSISFNQDNKTFWFAPGIHTLAAGSFSNITPGDNSIYVGAPGAILDGMNDNLYAFIGTSANVTIKNLEIRNFGGGNDNNNEGVINHDSGTGWIMEYLYAHHNDGAAVFIGSSNTLRYSCLKDNGQYGFSMFKEPIPGDSAIEDIVLDHNEITGNNQDDWESQINGCGCTGAGKFWDVKGARVTHNYVHDNLSTGLWADTNDIDFLFDSNWIDHNEGEGIWYEISYNATMSRNVITRNAWTTGNNNTGSPGPAIYISESGGDSRLASSTSGSTNLQIKNNLIEDNFSGISIFENSNRFCNSNGNTSKGYCTPFVTPTIIPEPHNDTYPNPINSSHPCYTSVGSAPYTANCRWHSQNVQVFNNEFRFTEAHVPCAGTFCGVQALFATGADNISWAPTAYNVANVQNDVMFNNNNKFFNNTYHGNWSFAKGYGEKIYYDTWQAGPFLQDTGSSFDGSIGPPPSANALDTNTATLEGSSGHWESWYSDTVSQSTAEAHSGTHSLKVDVTSSGGWGVQLDNWPGFDAGPGPKNISFWAKQGTGAIANVTMTIEWRNSSNSVIQTDTVPLTGLATSWQQATAHPTAPAGTVRTFIKLQSSSGSAGNSLYLDDIAVGDDI